MCKYGGSLHNMVVCGYDVGSNNVHVSQGRDDMQFIRTTRLLTSKYTKLKVQWTNIIGTDNYHTLKCDHTMNLNIYP